MVSNPNQPETIGALFKKPEQAFPLDDDMRDAANEDIVASKEPFDCGCGQGLECCDETTRTLSATQQAIRSDIDAVMRETQERINQRLLELVTMLRLSNQIRAKAEAAMREAQADLRDTRGEIEKLGRALEHETRRANEATAAMRRVGGGEAN